jgi:hypothetical protein
MNGQFHSSTCQAAARRTAAWRLPENRRRGLAARACAWTTDPHLRGFDWPCRLSHPVSMSSQGSRPFYGALSIRNTARVQAVSPKFRCAAHLAVLCPGAAGVAARRGACGRHDTIESRQVRMPTRWPGLDPEARMTTCGRARPFKGANDRRQSGLMPVFHPQRRSPDLVQQDRLAVRHAAELSRSGSCFSPRSPAEAALGPSALTVEHAQVPTRRIALMVGTWMLRTAATACFSSA